MWTISVTKQQRQHNIENRFQNLYGTSFHSLNSRAYHSFTFESEHSIDRSICHKRNSFSFEGEFYSLYSRSEQILGSNKTKENYRNWIQVKTEFQMTQNQWPSAKETKTVKVDNTLRKTNFCLFVCFVCVQ